MTKKIKNINMYLMFILTIGLILLTAGSVFATIRVEPSRIILNALERERSTGMIEVVNNGEEEVELTTVLKDWSLDERDSVVVFEAGETEYTLDGLIKFNPREFTLAPGQKQIVRFTISSPEAETPIERRGIVFVEHETDLIDNATGSRVKSQIGTTIYYIPVGVKYDFKFTGLRVYNSPEPMPQGISLRIKNDGNGHLRYYPAYKIVDQNNKLVMEDKFTQLLILPKNERQFSFYLKDRLEPGNYKFMLEFSFYNTDRVAEYQIPIKIE
ncbi:fimbrial biogenesis chaperone [Halanaerobium kushneri]|uniref:P pilus assembly protein, chaperone PapD n=1 Tax=Halanaerobium kushneri TaxID=56779 RepID=A0A1N7BP30_9FIRM|nr:molecular chaperone [Halanaerobium kushneri]SIR52934.1 P pilus assembly protein, chaperone PapD [Halanaerobium kushneri]